jgi:NADPH-dependent curcumin reductase CurA
MLEAVLNVANSKARIPCCGMISQYNVQDKEGIRNMFMVSLLHSLDALHLTDQLWLSSRMRNES